MPGIQRVGKRQACGFVVIAAAGYKTKRKNHENAVKKISIHYYFFIVCSVKCGLSQLLRLILVHVVII